MRNKIKAICALIFGAMFACSGLGACAEEDTSMESSSHNTPTMEETIFSRYEDNQEFGFYSYGAPGTDDYSANEAKIKQYAEAGFNRYMLLGCNGAKDSMSDWTTSHRAINLENARKYGVKDAFMRDYVLTSYARRDSGTLTLSDEELEEIVINRLGYYATAKNKDGSYAIQGIDIGDEPWGRHYESYVRVYKMVLKVAKEVYNRPDFQMYVCLLPAYGGTELYTTDGVKATETERYVLYREYLRKYLDGTGAKKVAIDVYPFMGVGKYIRFERGYYASLQILAEECKRVGATYALVAQTYSDPVQKDFRVVNEAEMKLQMNSLIGFGAKDIGFFRYEPLENSYQPEAQFVGADRITKNPIYDMAKNEIATAKKFDHIMLGYDYSASAIYASDTEKYAYYVAGVENDTFQKVAVTAGEGVTLVTELYDEKNDLYMYMLQNVLDTVYTGNAQSKTIVKVNFGDCKKVAVIFEGKTGIVELEQGEFVKELSTGEGVYVIPLK